VSSFISSFKEHAIICKKEKEKKHIRKRFNLETLKFMIKVLCIRNT